MIEYEPADEVLGNAVRRRATAVGVAPTFDELGGREYGIDEGTRSAVRRRTLVAVGVVLVVIGIAVWRSRGVDVTTEDPVTRPIPTADVVATSFQRAVFESGDPQVALSLMTPDAVMHGAGRLDTDRGREALIGIVGYFAELDTRLTVMECELLDYVPEVQGTDAPEGTEVTAARCLVAYTNVFYEAAGLESSPVATMIVRVQDELMFDSPDGPPPQDHHIETHFQSWAIDQLGLGELGRACPTFGTYRGPDCARLILDNLDAWAEAWRGDQE